VATFGGPTKRLVEVGEKAVTGQESLCGSHRNIDPFNLPFVLPSQYKSQSLKWIVVGRLLLCLVSLMKQ
jgi:hypothetical protein